MESKAGMTPEKSYHDGKRVWDGNGLGLVAWAWEER